MLRRFFLYKLVCCASSLKCFSSIFDSIYNKPMLRFGLLTDLHYSLQSESGTRFYRDSMSKLDEAINVFNSENLDFVIELGDFKDQNIPPSREDVLSFLCTIEKKFQECQSETYHWVIMIWIFCQKKIF